MIFDPSHRRQSCAVLLIAIGALGGWPQAARCQEPDHYLRTLPPGAQGIASFPPVGRELRPYEFSLLNGGTFTPRSVAGRPTVFLLWAIGCSGAQRIVGEVDSLQLEVGRLGASLVLVSLDTSSAAVDSALGGQVRATPVVLATGWRHVFTSPAVEAQFVPGTPMGTMTPSLVIVDSTGVVRYAAPWEYDHNALLVRIRAAVGTH